MKKLFMLFMLAMLSACGGGGGGGSGSGVTSPQPTIKLDASNTPQVSATGMSSDSVTTNIGGLGIYSATQPTKTTVKLTDFTLKLFHLGQQPVLQTQLFESLCTTGSVTEPPVGSTSGTYVFTDCNTGTEVINGKVSFSFSGSSSNFTVSVSYINFTFGYGVNSIVNATLVLSQSSSATSTTTKSTFAKFDLEVGNDYVRLYNFSMTRTESTASPIIATDFDYTFESSYINGIVRVTTSPSEGGQTMLQNISDPFAYSGSFVVIGANSRARVSATGNGLANGDITLEIDNNGDGVYDETSTMAWADFSILSAI
jgi:hypothetical protein